MKDDYLTAISAAGFGEVAVVAEDAYPVQLAENDPIAWAVSDTGMALEQLKDIAVSVVSIKVSAIKPG